MSIGTSMMGVANSGMSVNVGVGRAWFDHTWTHNDAVLAKTLSDSDLLLNRIDAIVLEVNATEAVRFNDIKIVNGTPSSVPVNPTLASEPALHQYPLAYIYVGAGVTEITQANITNMVGTASCPFVTGVLETINIDSLIAQWETQWSEWLTDTQNDTATWTADQRASFLAWVDQQRTDFVAWVTVLQNDMTAFQNASETDFITWFNNVKGQLSTDVAGNLQNQINAIIEQEFYRYHGLMSKQTDVVKDETGYVSSVVETSSDAISTTTFTKTDNVQTATTEIVPSTGTLNYTKTSVVTTTESGYAVAESFISTFKA
ncbi:hypothetical protein [Bacteroides sp.]|uniref:hypothetical protein n=1 Tax=Bacteroides sp. TaxID=29523 RepID=UPI002612DE44|nr:hypothetical protein [Bacteroides sp.]MDD3040087.1 hypothetical protein [Bacteroides sp.]